VGRMFLSPRTHPSACNFREGRGHLQKGVCQGWTVGTRLDLRHETQRQEGKFGDNAGLGKTRITSGVFGSAMRGLDAWRARRCGLPASG
jgi:hypothetical protein